MARLFLPVILLAGLSLVTSWGCVAQRAGLEIPEKARVVGGGVSIDFVAPEDGILYLVDSRKFVMSRTIRKGQRYIADGEFPVGRGEVVVLKDARLYFEPQDLTGVPDSTHTSDALADLEKGLSGPPTAAPAGNGK